MRLSNDPSQKTLFETAPETGVGGGFDTRPRPPRLLEPELLLPTPLRPLVIRVRHWLDGEETEKMVGKLIQHPDYGFVFFHANSGSQWHRKYRCPAPVDAILVAALLAAGVKYYYSYDRKNLLLWRTETAFLALADEELFGNRRRRYLGVSAWERRENVREVRMGRTNLYVAVEGVHLFSDPWVKEEWVLGESGF